MLTLFLLAFLAAPQVADSQPGKAIIREEAAFDYIYTDHQGGYEAIPSAISAFMAEFFKQGQQPSGPLMGMYLNYAQDTKAEDLKWQIAMAVSPEARVTPPLKKASFPGQKVIALMRKGPYDTVGESYELLFGIIAEKGYEVNGPAIERYFSDPATTPPQDILTEILIPVCKKN